MTYEQHCGTCLAAEIGEGGLTDETLARTLGAAAPSLTRLGAAWRAQDLAQLPVPRGGQDLAACRPVAEAYRESFDEVLVLGMGGSSLGGQTLATLSDPRRSSGPRLRFLANVDPHSFETLLEGSDLARLGLIVISKSGGTAETMAQFLVLLQRLREAQGDTDLARRITVISDPGDNPLRRIAARFGLPCLDHEAAVGGRFSVLTNVGLLPTMIAGLDAAAVRAGAEEALGRSLSAAQPADSPAALGAAISVGLLNERHIAQSVLMPYADRLASLSQWYRQLWAESLGKDGKGTTPIDALGTVDQHSQLQLYLAGPRDKMFTLVRLATEGEGPAVDPALVADSPLAYLGGRRLGDLMAAMARATADTLANNGRPVRVFALDRLDEAVLGGLFAHFMLETLITADLLGVDPFGQPAVEEGKVLARRYLAETAP